MSSSPLTVSVSMVIVTISTLEGWNRLNEIIWCCMHMCVVNIKGLVNHIKGLVNHIKGHQIVRVIAMIFQCHNIASMELANAQGS